jgi:hypothetical protein
MNIPNAQHGRRCKNRPLCLMERHFSPVSHLNPNVVIWFSSLEMLSTVPRILVVGVGLFRVDFLVQPSRG